MFIDHEVNYFITSHRPAAVCDKCIVESVVLTTLELSQEITAALGATTGFVQERGECSLCKNERMVIHA